MKKTVIVFGNYEGYEAKAVNMLTRFLVPYLNEMPACIQADNFCRQEGERYIFVGTKSSNRILRAQLNFTFSQQEEYYICVEKDEVMIGGSDSVGVLYGCVDFYNRYLMVEENTHNHSDYFRNIFEKELPDFCCSSFPKVRSRGLWTWGHVIRDYEGYLDHMALCKLNTLVLWDDYLPLNATDILNYAHMCGVKILWGFSWLWDTDCHQINLNQLDDTAVDNIVSLCINKYLPMGGDGIYFQSFTELHEERIGGILIAQAVANFVNRVAEKIFMHAPNLELQFGLHANSVRERLDYIAMVNPNVRIIWEDCGAFPFTYCPSHTEGFMETKHFAEKLASLRGENEKMGVVFKGFTCLDWNRFRHQSGPFVLGESSRKFRLDGMHRKEKIWRYVQAYWMIHAKKVQEMVRVLRENNKNGASIYALVEDGFFEEKIYFPVAVYSEILWDCNTETDETIVQTALREYVEFA